MYLLCCLIFIEVFHIKIYEIFFNIMSQYLIVYSKMKWNLCKERTTERQGSSCMKQNIHNEIMNCAEEMSQG